jgi:lysophospholipase L1-like esterase
MKTTFRFCLSSLVLALSAFLSGSTLHAAPALTPGARLAIIGDSITEQKLYSKYMEAYLLACSGISDLKTFQFGWGGETASGFAARVENDLAAFKPTVATTCYGMNDGRYRPFTNEIGQAYEKGMRAVVEGLRQAGVRDIIIGSPGAVDTKYFVRENFKPLSGADGYNQNLAALRDIDRRLASELNTGFADVHQPMIEAMAKAKQALGDDYDVCGRDGFHPGPNGHLIMAYAFLRALGCDGKIGELTIDMNGPAKATGSGHQVVGGQAGVGEFASTRYPFGFEGNEKSSDGTLSVSPFLPFNEELNRLILKVTGLQSARARVTWGTETREFSREQLSAGVNLPAAFARTPFSAHFSKLLQAVGAKQSFETLMIKNMVTAFRQFKTHSANDPELAAAFAKVGQRLVRQQEQLHEAAIRLIVPVNHTLTVTPLP